MYDCIASVAFSGGVEMQRLLSLIFPTNVKNETIAANYTRCRHQKEQNQSRIVGRYRRAMPQLKLMSHLQ